MATNITVTVYSKPACVQCNATYRAMERKGVSYGTPVDVTEDAAALELIKGLGHLQAPVVVIREDGVIVDSWSGFRPDKIEELAAIVPESSLVA